MFFYSEFSRNLFQIRTAGFINCVDGRQTKSGMLTNALHRQRSRHRHGDRDRDSYTRIHKHKQKHRPFLTYLAYIHNCSHVYEQNNYFIVFINQNENIPITFSFAIENLYAKDKKRKKAHNIQENEKEIRWKLNDVHG